MIPFYTKNNYKPLFLLKRIFKSKNSHKNYQSLTNKHKVKYIITACTLELL